MHNDTLPNYLYVYSVRGGERGGSPAVGALRCWPWFVCRFGADASRYGLTVAMGGTGCEKEAVKQLAEMRRRIIAAGQKHVTSLSLGPQLCLQPLGQDSDINDPAPLAVPSFAKIYRGTSNCW
jgi:hypothetical protein